ncbi:MAG: VCBS repeat-containing protein [Myxococcota bacterium]
MSARTFAFWVAVALPACGTTSESMPTDARTDRDAPSEEDAATADVDAAETGSDGAAADWGPEVFEEAERFIGGGSLAIAVADFNGDDRLDLVAPAVGQPNVFYVVLNRPAPDGSLTFESIRLPIRSAGPDGLFRQTKGLGLHDFDNDGRMDVYLGNSGPTGPCLAPDEVTVRPGNPNLSPSDSVQQNLGGRFESRDLGIDSQSSTARSIVFADFDGDGHRDSYHSVSPYYGPGWCGNSFGNQLHAGSASGQFGPDVIRDVLPDPGFWHDEYERGVKLFKATLVRDFDGDGLPDIATGAYSDIWGGSLRRLQTPDDERFDVDGDGTPDTTWPGYWGRGIYLLRNVSTPGEIRFSEVANEAIDRANSDGSDHPQMHVYSLLAFDLDLDGDLDLLANGPRNPSAHRSIEDQTPTVRLLRNDSTPGVFRFVDVTEEAGLAFLNEVAVPGYREGGRTVPNLASGAAIDLDNDSFVDLVLLDRKDGDPSAPIHPWVFRNLGGRFARVPQTEHRLDGNLNEISYGDFDRDGYVDIAVTNGDPMGAGALSVYRNNLTTPHHWVGLRVGWAGNPFGLESRVTVFAAGTERILGHDELRTDFNYRSKRPPELHFGLGDVEVVDVRVESREGTVGWFRGLAANQLHRLDLSQAREEQ